MVWQGRGQAGPQELRGPFLSVSGAGRPPWRSYSRCTPSGTCTSTAPTRLAASNWTTGSWQVGPSGVWDPRTSAGSPCLPAPNLSCPSSASLPPQHPWHPHASPAPLLPSPRLCTLALFPGPPCVLARPEAARVQLSHSRPLSTGLLAQRIFVMLPCGGVGVSVPRVLEQALPRALRSPFHSPRPHPACLFLWFCQTRRARDFPIMPLCWLEAPCGQVCPQPTSIS